MAKLKVMTIMRTRPEIIRLSACILKHVTVISTIYQCIQDKIGIAALNWVFLMTGLHTESYLDSALGNTLGETMGNIIAKSYDILQKEQPDALPILGDTNSALSAIAAIN